MNGTWIRTLADLQRAALQIGTPPAVVVAAAGDAISLEAVVAADAIGLASGILVGPADVIRDRLEHMEVGQDRFEIVDAADPVAAAGKAVDLIGAGRGEILLKGSVSSAALLHAVLSSRQMRTGRLLSDVVVFEDDRNGEPRLILLSDGGVNIAPNLKQKVEIVRNAVWVAHRLGLERPKVALLSGVERVTPDMASTIDAVALAKMASYGDVITGCTVDGPFALDNAISLEAAKIKGIESPVAGAADVLIVPSLENGNILGKALMYYGGKTLAHVIVGAGAPVLICSRADSVQAKLASIALGALCSSRVAA